MSPIKLKCSAPGKIILHGEHSVVYGKLAIAASLDLRTSVTIEERTNMKFEVNFVDLKFKRHFSLVDIKAVPFRDFVEEEGFLFPEHLDQDQLMQTIKTSLNLSEESLGSSKYSSLISLLYLFYGIVAPATIEALYICVKTDLTLGSGTGSSASLMVCLSSAFLQYLIIKNPDLKQKFEITEPYDCFNEFQLKLISKWGFEAEKIIHGNPSGIDNTVCTYGSLVSFRKGRAPFAVKCSREIRGLIVDTRTPKNTKIQVGKVADLRQKHLKLTENLLESLETVATESLDLLIQLGDSSSEIDSKGIYQDLGRLCLINHHLLQALGVSHPNLDKTVELMSAKGLKGKMTGAGGGGYAVALIPPFVGQKDVEELCSDLEKCGFKGLVIKLGSSGVRFEK